jgi:hypothetical protein
MVPNLNVPNVKAQNPKVPDFNMPTRQIVDVIKYRLVKLSMPYKMPMLQNVKLIEQCFFSDPCALRGRLRLGAHFMTFGETKQLIIDKMVPLAPKIFILLHFSINNLL